MDVSGVGLNFLTYRCRRRNLVFAYADDYDFQQIGFLPEAVILSKLFQGVIFDHVEHMHTHTRQYYYYK